MAGPGGLTKRQERFVREYVKDLNAAAAARRAGYGEGRARQTGSELLRNERVREALRLAEAGRLAEVEVSADRVLREESRIAFFDPRRLFHPEGHPQAGRLKSPAEFTEDEAAAVASFEVVEERGGAVKYKVKLHDKGAALARLHRHLGLAGEEGGEGRAELAGRMARIIDRKRAREEGGAEAQEDAEDDGEEAGTAGRG